MQPLEAYASYLRFELNRSEATVRMYLSDLHRFIGWMEQQSGDFRPEAVEQRHVRAWLADRARQECTPRSLRRFASSLAAYFRYLQRLGAIDANPLKGLKLPKISRHLPAPVKEEEMERLLTAEETAPACEETAADRFRRLRDAMIIELLYATGMRRAELASLNDADISPTLANLRVTGKRGKQRILPLAPELLGRIAEYRQARDTCFPDRTDPSRPLLLGNRGRRLNLTALAGIVKVELSATHAARKSPHTLRHTFATAMLDGGADIRTLKELLGHSSLSTTQIYTHLSVDELKKNYNRAHPRAHKKN